VRALLIAAVLLSACAKPEPSAPARQMKTTNLTTDDCPSFTLFDALTKVNVFHPVPDATEIYPTLYDDIAKAVECDRSLTGPVQTAFKDSKITFGELRELVRIESLQAAKDAEAEHESDLINAKEKLRQKIGPFTASEMDCMKDPHCHMFYGTQGAYGRSNDARSQHPRDRRHHRRNAALSRLAGSRRRRGRHGHLRRLGDMAARMVDPMKYALGLALLILTGGVAVPVGFVWWFSTDASWWDALKVFGISGGLFAWAVLISWLMSS
jgi:hypothetical protein